MKSEPQCHKSGAHSRSSRFQGAWAAVAWLYHTQHTGPVGPTPLALPWQESSNMLVSPPLSFTNGLSCFSVTYSCLQNQCHTGDSYIYKEGDPPLDHSSCILTEETLLGRLHLNDAGLSHSQFLAEEFTTYQKLLILLGKDKTTTTIFEPNLKLYSVLSRMTNTARSTPGIPQVTQVPVRQHPLDYVLSTEGKHTS